MKLTTTKTHILELEHDELLAIRNVLVKATTTAGFSLDDMTQDIVHDFIETMTGGIFS